MPQLLYSRERVPGTHWKEGWGDHRADLDVVAKRKIPAPASW